jgi:uncharacterized protein YggE
MELATMRSLLLATACALLATGVGRADITVNGEGVVQVRPDMAEIRVEFEVGGYGTAEEAKKGWDRRTESLVKSLTGLKVKSDDIRSPQPLVTDHGPVSPIYYATGALVVTLRDLSVLSKVIALLDESSGKFSLQFGITDLPSATDKARKQAIADARRRASLYANEAEVKLGQVKSLEEVSVQQPRFSTMHYGRTNKETRQYPVISEHAIKVSVRVNYSIKE